MYTKVYLSLKNLNFYSKLLGLLFITLSILVASTSPLIVALILLEILLSFFLKDYKSLQMSIILIIVFMFYYLHPFLLIIVKGLLLYVNYLIAKDLIVIKERKYLFDKFFYKFKSKFFTRMYLSNNYKNYVFLNNMGVYNKINKVRRRKYSSYIIKQATMKTSYDLQDIAYRNKLSYYGFSNKKKPIVNMQWNNIDNTFLLVPIMIFILVIFYR